MSIPASVAQIWNSESLWNGKLMMALSLSILILQIDAPVCRLMRASKSLIALLTSGLEVKDQENIMPLNSSVMSKT